jgi:chemotaxis protein histidine kinase CheA
MSETGKELEGLVGTLEEGQNRATQEVYDKATTSSESVNHMMQQHLLREDEDLGALNTHEDFLDAVKNAADYIKMRPPQIPLTKEQQEEEEKKESEETKEAAAMNDQYAEQITKLVDMEFTDLKANISALTETKGDIDAAIDILIANSRKPVAFSIPPTSLSRPSTQPSEPFELSERFILERTR